MNLEAAKRSVNTQAAIAGAGNHSEVVHLS